MTRPDARPRSSISVRFSAARVLVLPVLSHSRPCVGCGAAILGCETPRGKWIPVNQDPEPDGIHLVHFATCPKAGAWRRSGKGVR